MEEKKRDEMLFWYKGHIIRLPRIDKPKDGNLFKPMALHGSPIIVWTMLAITCIKHKHKITKTFNKQTSNKIN